MFNKYHANVKATIALLKFLRIRVNNATVNETLQNHPDWPSLLCISDSLNKWNIPNAAGKIEELEIDQLPTPFMAYTANFHDPLYIVTEVKDDVVISYSKEFDKPVSESKEDFLKIWKGIYLIAEKTENSGEKEYKLNRRKGIIKDLIPISLIIILFFLSFLHLFQNHRSVSEDSIYLPYFLQYFILIAGLIVTSLLLWYEIDSSNPILHKVCTGFVKGNCDAILSGKQSKLFNWLSWSEVGFFYFAGGLLILLFTEPLNNSISIIALLNVLALPYTIFSVYYQGRVAKQWCVFCLAIQVLLILGGINVLANGMILSLQQNSFFLLLQCASLYIIPVLLWFTIKPFLLRLQEAKNTKREYLRIKFNSEIFETLLKKQKQVTFSTHGLGIDIGNQEATNTLIKVCNPYCNPCSKAHSVFEKLLEIIPNLKIKIIFATPNDPLDKSYKPVNHLMSINSQKNNNGIIKQALDDWYLADNKDYERFASKYPMNGELVQQDEKIEAMFKWYRDMDVRFTPTIFINGYQLPEVYLIEDLQYFLLE